MYNTTTTTNTASNPILALFMISNSHICFAADAAGQQLA
jgi:hypothetical protein